ncbi:T9SS type A sorting domain-containing protein [uncultured Arcticibacterium sp.]|uniref:T9SS type A sorting domain-containing protein n=1 Tax=uncultured Arcticibacterium sp. TaxID=2173042 RepID=UPI0030FA8E98
MSCVLFPFLGFGQESAIPEPIVCHADKHDAFFQVLAEGSEKARRTVTSNIDVSYTGFPDVAQIAFEKAVSIWETLLISNQPIRINAKWENIGGGTTLAYSGATRIYRNIDNAPYRDVWYVCPLAEAISGKDLNDGDFDINVTLNSNTNWSYSTDGTTFSGKFDLVTVALHEIAHGLGFSSSMKLINNESEGQWGQSSFPYIFDTFVQTEEGESLVDKSNYLNPSEDLKEEMVSNSLVFNVTNDNYRGRTPEIYSPEEYKEGASLSHIDFRDANSSTDTPNAYSIMSPSILAALAIHKPSGEVLTILNEIGWPVNNLESFVILGEEPKPKVLVFPNPVQKKLAIAVPIALRSENTEVVLTNNSGKVLMELQKNTLVEPTFYISFNNYPPGIHFLTVNSEKGKFTKKLVKR